MQARSVRDLPSDREEPWLRQPAHPRISGSRTPLPMIRLRILVVVAAIGPRDPWLRRREPEACERGGAVVRPDAGPRDRQRQDRRRRVHERQHRRESHRRECVLEQSPAPSRSPTAAGMPTPASRLGGAGARTGASRRSSRRTSLRAPTRSRRHSAPRSRAGRSCTSTNTRASTRSIPLDGTAGAIGTASAMSSGALTTTAAGDLLFAAGASTVAVTAAGTGWTTRSTVSGNRTAGPTRDGSGPYTATATQNGTGWVMRWSRSGPPRRRIRPRRPSRPASPRPPISSTQINLSWAASTDNVGVAGYKVFRDGTPVATTTTPVYQDTELTPSTTYTYAVSATDAAGNESARSTTRERDHAGRAGHHATDGHAHGADRRRDRDGHA